MSRRIRLGAAAAAATIVALAGAPLAAQTSEPDSLRTTSPAPAAEPRLSSLPPVVSIVTRPDESGFLQRLGGRPRIDRLSRENRRLERDLASYDRQVVRLERHLDSLKTVVSDSLQREIDRAESLAARMRAERLRLEAQLLDYEARRGISTSLR
jgi:hypothetical protein